MDIILFVFSNIASNTLTNLVGVSVISEVGVICDDEDRVFCTLQKVVPVLASVKKNLSYSYLFPSYPQNKRNKM